MKKTLLDMGFFFCTPVDFYEADSLSFYGQQAIHKGATRATSITHHLPRFVCR